MMLQMLISRQLLSCENIWKHNISSSSFSASLFIIEVSIKA